jgi:hypothetical protein
VCLARSGTVGEGGSAASRAAAAEGIDGEGAPVDDGRQEAVRELSGSEAKLARVLSWAERLWRGGLTAGLGSPAFCGWRRRSGTSEQGNGKIAKGLARRGSCSAVARERRRAGVLYRAGHGGGEVAAGGWICGAWHGMEGTMRRAIAVRSFSATRGRSAQAGGGLRPALSGRRRCTGGQRKQEGRQEVEEGWIYL